MAREKKTKASEQENTVSVDMAKLTEGINLVFSGAVKMLEAMGTVDVNLALNAANIPAVVDTGGEPNVEETDKATEETVTTSIQPQEKTEEKTPESLCARLVRMKHYPFAERNSLTLMMEH